MELKNIITPDQKIKNKAGDDAASKRSCDAKIYDWVANVSKLNGLKIKVMGNSLIISSDIRIPINKKLFLR